MSKFQLVIDTHCLPGTGGRSLFGMVADLFELQRQIKDERWEVKVNLLKDGERYTPEDFVKDFSPSIIQQTAIFGKVLDENAKYSYDSAWELKLKEKEASGKN